MSRYDWLKTEIALVPRKKFHIFESRSLAVLEALEDRYERLPIDYREFVEEFGCAKLFRNSRNPWHNLIVDAPPNIEIHDDGVVRIDLAYYSNTGAAWFECRDGKFVDDAAVFSGFSRGRRKAAACFEEWLKGSVAAAKKLYSKEQWTAILKPVPPFTASELQILEAIPQFLFQKAGVTSGGNLLIEIDNKSSTELPYLTVGARDDKGMQGQVAIQTGGITPGTSKVIERPVYAKSMNPHTVELFRLPLPDPEDRAYFAELKDDTSERRNATK